MQLQKDERVRVFFMGPSGNSVRSAENWIGGITEAQLPQCHRCLHYLYLSAVIDTRNPKKVLFLIPGLLKDVVFVLR